MITKAMKKKIEVVIKERVERWQRQNGVVFSDQEFAISALTTALLDLQKTGLSQNRQDLLLNLLRLYVDWDRYKTRFERWITNASSVADRLMRLAKDYEDVLPDHDADVDELRAYADNLRHFVEIKNDLLEGQLFRRKLGRSYALTMASELIRTGTQPRAPRYRQLATLLSAVSNNDKDIDPGSVRKQVRRFINRNPAKLKDLRSDLRKGRYRNW